MMETYTEMLNTSEFAKRVANDLNKKYNSNYTYKDISKCISMTDNKIKMPVWGPYSKKYMGISKIINELADKGARYDFSIHPTLWNSSTPVPNVTVPSNYHLWNCKNDYTFYSYLAPLSASSFIIFDMPIYFLEYGPHTGIFIDRKSVV